MAMENQRFDGPRVVRMLVQVVMYGVLFLLLRAGSRWLFGVGSASDWPAVTRYVIVPAAVILAAITILGTVFALITMSNQVAAMRIRPGGPDGWPPASGPIRERFRRLGFEQFGSIEVDLPDHTAVFAGTLSPDGTTMAVVSPLHIVFVSDFDGKLLTTTSQPSGAPNSYELRQSRRHGSPEELWSIHQGGIAAATAAGANLTVFTAATAMTAFVQMEQSGKADFSSWHQAKYLLTKAALAGRTRTLASDPRAPKLIEAWRRSPHRWQPAA